jgi:hypothetical protein
VVVWRVGESAWILRPTKALATDVVDALRDVFLEAVDDGAENVVVDLTHVGALTRRGAATIRAMTDLMRGRNGTLWLAARRSDTGGYTLRALGEDGRSSSVGVSIALDSALRELSAQRLRRDSLRKPSHGADLGAIDPEAPLRRYS